MVYYYLAYTLRYTTGNSQVKYPISRIENNSCYKEGTEESFFVGEILNYHTCDANMCMCFRLLFFMVLVVMYSNVHVINYASSASFSFVCFVSHFKYRYLRFALCVLLSTYLHTLKALATKKQ